MTHLKSTRTKASQNPFSLFVIGKVQFIAAVHSWIIINLIKSHSIAIMMCHCFYHSACQKQCSRGVNFFSFCKFLYQVEKRIWQGLTGPFWQEPPGPRISSLQHVLAETSNGWRNSRTRSKRNGIAKRKMGDNHGLLVSGYVYSKLEKTIQIFAESLTPPGKLSAGSHINRILCRLPA